jgi:hypothetical protein
MSEQELIELLADKHHVSWARWMRSIFSKCQALPDGSLVISAELASHWRQQIYTPYAELSEHEQQLDRGEVTRIMPYIREYGASLPVKDEWTKAIRSHIRKLNEQEQ